MNSRRPTSRFVSPVASSSSTTLQGQATTLPMLLAALELLPVRVLLTLGGVVPTDSVVAPPNTTVRGYVPHDLALPPFLQDDTLCVVAHRFAAEIAALGGGEQATPEVERLGSSTPRELAAGCVLTSALYSSRLEEGRPL